MFVSLLILLLCIGSCFAVDVDLSMFGPAKGFAMEAGTGDFFGVSVKRAGDINRDGYDDIVIGAEYEDPPIGTDAGIVYVIYGRNIPSGAQPFANMQMPIGPLATNTGFRILGAVANQRIGKSVSAAGDVNDDGTDDIIIGAPGFNDVYVIYGRNIPGGATAFGDIQLLTANTPPSIGFHILGTGGSITIGRAVSGAGDVNGDDISDVIVGSVGASIAYVIFGNAAPTAYQLPTTAMSTDVGFRLIGSGYTGSSVSIVDDLNGDRFADILVGDPGFDSAAGTDVGAVYVVFGRAAFADVALSALTPTEGFRIEGAAADGNLGACNGAGDVNGDGIGDIIVGAYLADSSVGADTGIAYVIFGRGGASPFSNILLSSSALPVDIGFRILGADAFDYLGFSVSAAGDLNGDSIGDVIVGAYGADPPGTAQAGISYVIYGRDIANGAPPFPDIQLSGSALPDTVGFRILGVADSDNSGHSVSSAGDLNNDGVGDVIVGAYSASRAYIVFGTYSMPTSQPSSQPSHQPTAQPSRQPTRQPTGQPSIQPQGIPSSQPSRQPTLQPTSQPSARPSTQPSRQPSGKPSGQPTLQPSEPPTFQPSVQPSSQPSRQPSKQPLGQPSSQPTHQPQTQPTAQPTMRPTLLPSAQPSGQPTSQPSIQPSARPSWQPSSVPSAQPTVQPSSRPTSQPSSQPTVAPTTNPSAQPTRQPSCQPSAFPSIQPVDVPSSQPSVQPTVQLSRQPSAGPSSQPTSLPTSQPTAQPTRKPSSQPSSRPSNVPSALPTMQPSKQPSRQPSVQPSAVPSTQPSRKPSSRPSGQPSCRPTALPSVQPSSMPSSQPNANPTCVPSDQPTAQPSSQPSAQPTTQPSAQPSDQPSAMPSVTTYERIRSLILPLFRMKLAYLDYVVWVCGTRADREVPGVTCFRLDNFNTLSVLQLPFSGAEFLARSNTKNILIGGRGVVDTNAEVGLCEYVDTQLFCEATSYADTHFTAGTSVSIAERLVYVGTYQSQASISVVDQDSNKIRSYIYSSTKMKHISFLETRNPANFIGSVLSGVCENLASVTFILAGMVRTDSGAMTGMYLAPANGLIINKSGLVNAMALEDLGPDSFIIGGLELSDGAGMHAYLVRVNTLYYSILYGVRYTLREVDSSGRRILQGKMGRSSVGKGVVLLDEATYLLIEYSTLQNTTALTVLRTDSATGRIHTQVQISSETASLFCTDIIFAETSLIIACSVRYNATAALTMLIYADKELTFSQLPPGFARDLSTTFVAESVLFHRTVLAMAAQRASSVTALYSFYADDSIMSSAPTVRPTRIPSASPSSTPSCEPSISPSATPSVSPQPTSQPSSSGPTNTHKPTVKPTLLPSREPSNALTRSPSRNPSASATVQPTIQPSANPSVLPSVVASKAPSCAPTCFPSRKPSAQPTARSSSSIPSHMPTVSPTKISTTRSSAFSTYQLVLIIVGAVAGAMVLILILHQVRQMFFSCVRMVVKEERRMEFALKYNDTDAATPRWWYTLLICTGCVSLAPATKAASVDDGDIRKERSTRPSAKVDIRSISQGQGAHAVGPASETTVNQVVHPVDEECGLSYYCSEASESGESVYLSSESTESHGNMYDTPSELSQDDIESDAASCPYSDVDEEKSENEAESNVSD